MKKALSFKRTFKEGSYYKDGNFSLRFLKNGLGISRLGISIQARLFPRATDRNRIKRLIREFFRKYKHNLTNYYDIIIRPKNIDVKKAGYKHLEEGLIKLLEGAKIFKQQ